MFDGGVFIETAQIRFAVVCSALCCWLQFPPSPHLPAFLRPCHSRLYLQRPSQTMICVSCPTLNMMKSTASQLCWWIAQSVGKGRKKKIPHNKNSSWDMWTVLMVFFVLYFGGRTWIKEITAVADICKQQQRGKRQQLKQTNKQTSKIQNKMRKKDTLGCRAVQKTF